MMKKITRCYWQYCRPIPQWEKVLCEYQESEGYKRTLEAELGGIQALRAGSYGQSLGGTGKT